MMQEFKIKIEELNQYLDKYYNSLPETKDNRKWIRDGIVNIEEYFNSSKKVMWVLKEPRDGENSTGGGWSIVDSIREIRAKGGSSDSQQTFYPIVATTYALINNIDSLNQEKYNEYRQKSSVLNNIAYVNIQKFPALANSKDREIVEAFEQNSEALLKQIEVINPDVIIFTAGGNVFNKFLDRVRSNAILKDKCMVNTFHPAHRGNKVDYINGILNKVFHSCD
ncbi:hypothetical protein KRX57_01575 [Weeksellaceae bacterium TAE3-ERU29]|nr:hypothetical protein [Weeksellaceae bacterium TAE3-ERU29]